LGELAADRGNALGVPRRQLVEVLLHPVPRRRSIPFRHCQLADGEVGHPIAHLAERNLRAVRLFDAVEEFGCCDHACRIVSQLARQIRIRGDQDKEARARQEDQPGPDRQPGHDLTPATISRLSDRG
jgi:hypothetical protein